MRKLPDKTLFIWTMKSSLPVISTQLTWPLLLKDFFSFSSCQYSPLPLKSHEVFFMPLLRHLHNSILLYHIYVHVLGNLRAESLSIPYLFLFFKDFSYLFLETGKGREKERERNINVWLPLTFPLPGTWPATQACALSGNRTCSWHSIH